MFNILKKFLFLTILITFIFSLGQLALAQEKTKIYFFYGDGCPHCAKEEIFLDELEREYEDIEILRYEVWKNSNNAKLLADKIKELSINVPGVPITIIGNEAIVGYEDEKTTGEKIRSAIEKNINNGESAQIPEKVKIPILGEINMKNFSLPVLTIIIAALDGFNPCAMWVLLFLISLLLGMQDKKKMWILGIAFIASSAAVYFLFLSAWLNLFLFLGFVIWIRITIGVIALASGGYHLKEWWTNRKGVCKVTDGKKRKLIFEKLKKIILEKKFLFSLIGIIVLAAVVNLVELVCSAGLPAVYTQVLALSNLANWQYYAYLILYIFIFMLDDLLVFSIAMVTLQEKVSTAGYSRWSNLIGGIIMLIIGILLILKPGWLMFG